MDLRRRLPLIDLKAGSERRLTQLTSDFDIRDFDLSTDKSEILFDRVEESSTVALIDRTGSGGLTGPLTTLAAPAARAEPEAWHPEVRLPVAEPPPQTGAGLLDDLVDHPCHQH